MTTSGPAHLFPDLSKTFFGALTALERQACSWRDKRRTRSRLPRLLSVSTGTITVDGSFCDRRWNGSPQAIVRDRIAFKTHRCRHISAENRGYPDEARLT